MLLLCLLTFLCTQQASWSLSIPQCDGGWLTVSEVNTGHITCGPIDPSVEVQWLLFNESGLTRSIFCSLQNCVTTEDLAVSMGDGAHRELAIGWNKRVLAGNGQLICLAGSESATCKINVIHPADVNHCQISYVGNDFVHGRCNFTGAYSSNGTYQCLLRDYTPGYNAPGSSVYIAGNLTRNGSSVWCDVYFRFSFMKMYSIVMFPAGSRAPWTEIIDLNLIRGPMPPVTNCSSEILIAEGDSLACACQTNPLHLGAGFPPNTVVEWRDPLLAGVQENILIMHNITRVLSHPIENRCVAVQQTLRAPNTATTYVTVHVAYGPDHVTLTLDRERLAADGTLVLTCSASTFSPHVVFTWSGIHCDSILYEGPNSFCVVARPHIPAHQTVTCRAANSAFERLMKEASITLSAHS